MPEAKGEIKLIKKQEQLIISTGECKCEKNIYRGRGAASVMKSSWLIYLSVRAEALL